MRTLTFMRHAKSDWPSPEPAEGPLMDKDRPLAPRGLRDAPRMAAWMASVGLQPDLILASSAVRTRQTLSIVASTLNCSTVRTEFRDDFYLAEAEDMIEVVRACPGAARHILIIGHDPGLHDAAFILIGAGPPRARRNLAMKFPTAAVVVIDFEIDQWTGLVPGSGTLRHFMAPKQLPNP